MRCARHACFRLPDELRLSTALAAPGRQSLIDLRKPVGIENFQKLLRKAWRPGGPTVTYTLQRECTVPFFCQELWLPSDCLHFGRIGSIGRPIKPVIMQDLQAIQLPLHAKADPSTFA